MKELSRRYMIRTSIIGAISFIIGSMFLPEKSKAKVLEKVDTLKNKVPYKSDFTTTPQMLGYTTRLEIPPNGGWKQSTYYVVDSAYSIDNPICRRIFYSGFPKYGKQDFCNNVITSFQRRDGISDWYYIKAVYEIDINN